MRERALAGGVRVPGLAARAGRPLLSLAAWAQHVLDSFATVEETVAALREEPFVVVTAAVPGEQRLATMHLSISDATGDSAIFEYVGGELVIHHNREHHVVTSSPTFDQQLAINAYRQQVEGMLPGTNRASDRFARAQFYVDAVPKVAGRREAAAEVLGVMRNVSVPLGISTPGQPNISSTRWRAVADHLDRVYCFDTATSPSVWWVDLDDLDLSKGTPAARLDLRRCEDELVTGDVTSAFVDTPAFAFAGL